MRLHLVDGTYELFRAHYSKRPPHRAPDGSDKKATLALASAMLALLHDGGEAVTHVAVAFDNPIRSFRNELFDGYKTDEGVPPELLAQFDSAEDAVRALGMAVWSMRDFEADDALATGAARLAREVRGGRGGAAPPARRPPAEHSRPARAHGRRRRRHPGAAGVRREDRLGLAGEVHPPRGNPRRPGGVAPGAAGPAARGHTGGAAG